mmetsp:Transcript_41336/g.81641  ORF Transcript_41336/g.81641 Transcript_41336/m.81641 type:complete len:327 (-) Transcript_41336:43-1023(-)
MVLAAYFSAQVPHCGDGDDWFPLNVQQHNIKEALWWRSRRKEVCPCASAKDGKSVQAPKALVTRLLRHKPRAQQVFASCGDLAIDVEQQEESATEHELKEGECESNIRFECMEGSTGAASVVESEHATSSGLAGQPSVPGLKGEIIYDDFRESTDMLAEDVSTWCERELQRPLMEIPAALVPASPGKLHAASAKAAAVAAAAAADADLGRVILEARLSCRDESGIDVDLEHRSLQLHLCQRGLDAARRFLEEDNTLAPRFVRRYLRPLSSWLHEQLQAAPPEMAFTTHHVEGDLEEIVCWYSSHASITGQARCCLGPQARIAKNMS